MTARQVAIKPTAHDVVAAYLSAELNLDETDASVAEAALGDIVIFAVPWPAVAETLAGLPAWESALEFHFQTPHLQNVARILDEILATPFSLRRLTQAPETG